jgi:hypothetical protein
MARSSLQDTLSVGDPAHIWNFDLFLPVIPGSSDTRDLTFKCQSMDLPGTQLEPVDVALHGVQIPYAGRRMFTQTLNVTFLETHDWSTREKFRRWIESARSWRNNSGSFSTGYWVTAQAVTYDDIPTVVATTQINNMWPENMQEVQLDGSQNGAVHLQVSFRYTDWQTV